MFFLVLVYNPPVSHGSIGYGSGSFKALFFARVCMSFKVQPNVQHSWLLQLISMLYNSDIIQESIFHGQERPHNHRSSRHNAILCPNLQEHLYSKAFILLTLSYEYLPVDTADLGCVPLYPGSRIFYVFSVSSETHPTSQNFRSERNLNDLKFQIQRMVAPLINI